jgi:cytochrome c-type biogenesis protein CcmE
MSENRTVSIMLFILGPFLIAIGIGLSTVTQTLTYFSFYTQTVYPYVGMGSVMLTVGIIVLVVAFMKMRGKKTVTFEVKIPKTEQI